MKRYAVMMAAAAATACGPPAESPADSAQRAGNVAATAAEPARTTPVAAADVPPRVPVIEQELAYGEAASRNLVGFLALPADTAEPLPGLIVIHEWWGLNDDIKSVTRRLAGEGFIALAVDLYGGATAASPERARELMTAVVQSPDTVRGNLKQAYEYLDKYADAPRIGSIGWSLGGGWSLQTALMFPEELDAMVMYYGQVITDRAPLETLRMPLLGHFGALDESIPVRDVQAFRGTLLELGKSSEILIYSNVDSAFASSVSANYDAAVAEEAWQSTIAFLSRNLKAARGE